MAADHDVVHHGRLAVVAEALDHEADLADGLGLVAVDVGVRERKYVLDQVPVLRGLRDHLLVLVTRTFLLFAHVVRLPPGSAKHAIVADDRPLDQAQVDASSVDLRR